MTSEFIVVNMSGSGSRWLTEEVFKLIDMVQKDEAIYNPRHKYYFCRPYVENFWREVDLKLEKNPGASLAKWTNLRISFRREYTNYLEEKVSPCWSYFDRMFFLHPYLRKKHSQPKSLDSQVQDALVQISSLSNRLQRERAVAALAFNNQHTSNGQTTLDSYLDYYDDAEPNNSELDEIIEEERQEQQARFSSLDAVSLNNDIKSECIDEEQIDEYDSAVTANDEDPDELQSFMHNSTATTTKTATTTNSITEKRTQQRLHLNRLQMRTYHDELRSKRPRSQESNTTQRTTLFCNSTPAANSTNVSLVRPTIAKPLDLPSHNATTSANTAQLQSIAAPNLSHAVTTQRSTTTQHHHSHQNLQQTQHTNHHRLEMNAVAGNSVTSILPAAVSSGASPTRSLVAPLELCDCKTDPDAMFLMSLLPDIQKLNGRDRGKIKIAFQNILQDYLYPD